MGKLWRMFTVLTMVVTSASSCKSLLTNSVVNNDFTTKQTINDNRTDGENSVNPFISEIKITGFPTPFISAMAVGPDGTIFAGAVWKGLYKSTNGIDFQQVTNGIPNDLLIASIAISHDGKNIYLGSEQKGLYVSVDGGKTFNKFDKFDDGQHAEVILITADGNIYISAGRGLYASVDDGKTFHLVLDGDSAYFFTVGPDGTIFAGGSDLYKSTNDGSSFQKINQVALNGSRFRVAAIALDGTIYVSIEDNPEGRGFYKNGLYASVDGGKTFNKLNSLNNGESISVNGVVITITGTIFVTTIIGGYVSSDMGKTFNKLTDLPTDLIEPLIVTPDGTILAGGCGNYYRFNLNDPILDLNKPDYLGSLYDGFVYKKENKINIKKEYLATAVLDNKKLILPATNVNITVGEHILILTLKDEYQQYAELFGGKNGQITYKLWVKTAIAKAKINYTTNVEDTDLSLGLVSNLGNTNNAQIIQTKTKQGSSIHPAILSLKVDDVLINYAASFYVQGTVNEAINDFTETKIPQTFFKNLMITSDGIYHLHLVDIIGNVYDSYLELGENNWQLQGIFNDEILNKLKTKLNVSLNLTDPKQLAQATGWLSNYDNAAINWFNKSLRANAKGFDEDISKYLANNFEWFLKPLTYEPSIEPKFDDGLDKDALVKTINNKANEILKNELNNLPQNLNIDTTNVVNKSTLTSYTNWINNYQKFINDNKNNWVTNIANVAGRGYAKDDLIAIIKNYVKNNFNKYLQHVVWNPITSNDYQQFIELDKLQSDTIDWVNQNYSDINQKYQQAIKTAESGLDLHGYSITDILNGKKLPQTKDEIEHFVDGQSFHYWLQKQANIKFLDWQLTIGFSIAIPLLLLAITIGWCINKKYNPFTRVKKISK